MITNYLLSTVVHADSWKLLWFIAYYTTVLTFYFLLKGKLLNFNAVLIFQFVFYIYKIVHAWHDMLGCFWNLLGSNSIFLSFNSNQNY